MKWLQLLLKKIARKKIPIILIITISLSFIFALLISCTCVSNNLNDGYEKRLDNAYGIHHATYYNVYQEKDKIKSDKIESAGFIDVFGKLDAEHTFRSVVLGTADSTSLELHRIRLSEGRMPSDKNEAVVEEWVVSSSGLDVKIGETLELSFERYYVENYEVKTKPESMSVKIVGIVKNYSSVHLGKVDNEYAFLPSVIFGAAPYDNNVVACTLRLTDISNYDEDLKDINENIIYSECYAKNAERFKEVADEGSVTKFIKTTSLSLYVIVTLISVVFIFLMQFIFTYNLKGIIGTSEKLGITSAQKNMFIFISNMILTILALVPGILLGMVLSGSFTSYIANTFEIEIAQNAFGVGTVLISGIIFIAVSVVASMYIMTVYTKKASAKSNNIALPQVSYMKSPYKLISYKSAQYNTRKFMVSAVALALCMALSGIGVVYKSESKNKLFKNSSVDISVTSDAYDYDSFWVGGIRYKPHDNMAGVKEKLMELVEDVSIERYARTFNVHVGFLTQKDDDYYPDLPGIREMGEYRDLAEETNTEDKEWYDTSKESVYSTRALNAVNDEIFELLKRYDVKGEINVEEIKKGNEVVIATKQEYLGWSKELMAFYNSILGKTITLTSLVMDLNTREFTERVDIDVKVAAIVIVPSGNAWEIEALNHAYDSFLCSYDFAESKNLTYVWLSTGIKLVDPNVSASVEAKIAKMVKEYDILSADSNVTSKLEHKRTCMMINSTIQALAIALLGFALLFMIINYIENIITRKKIFRQLYVIGATPSQLNIIMITEYAITIIAALIIGLIPAVVIILYAFYVRGDVTALYAAVYGFVLPAAIVLLLCVPIYFINKKVINKIID